MNALRKKLSNIKTHSTCLALFNVVKNYIFLIIVYVTSNIRYHLDILEDMK